MNGLVFRPAMPEDKPHILEIAAQMWEGDDYIPDVIDAWLAPGVAQLIVAILDGRLVALAHYDRAFPGYAWFEGLRTDPVYQNRGLAKALTGHLIERARADGIERIGLSTYLDNYASQKVSAACGFTRVATFAYAEMERSTPATLGALSSAVEPLSSAEAAAFIAASDALRLGRGFLPHSWRFYPFARDPALALGHMQHLLGMRDGGELTALLCVGDQTPHGPGTCSIDFLDGERVAVAILARHALHLARDAKCVEAMIPWDAEQTTVALEVLREVGLKLWNDGDGDVYLYERALS